MIISEMKFPTFSVHLIFLDAFATFMHSRKIFYICLPQKYTTKQKKKKQTGFRPYFKNKQNKSHSSLKKNFI